MFNDPGKEARNSDNQNKNALDPCVQACMNIIVYPLFN